MRVQAPRLRRWAAAMFASALAVLPALPPSPANAYVGTFTLALIKVSYSDWRTHRYDDAQLTAAANEMRTYFSQLSNRRLDFQVRLGRADLSQAKDYYWAPCAVEGVETRRPCPPDLIADAQAAAVGNGLSMAGVNGVAVLSPFQRGDGDYSRGTYSWLFEGCSDPTCPERTARPANPPGPSQVWWSFWAHEFGHQIESIGGTDFDAPFAGHTSGYASGYDLMDSGYPDGESIYALTPPETSTRHFIFRDWLPPSKVQRVEAPTDGSTRTTRYRLAPLSVSPESTTALQGLKLPISTGVYITVEARRRSGADSYNTGPGIFDEGIHLMSVHEQDLLPVTPIDSCDYIGSGGCVRSDTDPRQLECRAAGARNLTASRPYCWPYALWHDGDTYDDPTNNIRIRVLAYDPASNTQEVEVVRGLQGGRPNLSITPWLTPPSNTWETRDIWIDSSCNGYGTFLYGLEPDLVTPRGNGDDPCANHENRIYARVTNTGSGPARNVVVNFSRSDPLGVGVGPQASWAGVGTASQATFPELGELGVGASAVVWVPWTPTVDVSMRPDRTSFAYHSCVRVSVQPAVGEVEFGNNNAQENISNFQVFTGAVMGRSQSSEDDVPPYELQMATVDAGAPGIATGSIHLKNEGKAGDPATRTFWIDTKADLPPGTLYSVGDDLPSVTLAAGEVRNLPVTVKLPLGIPPGRQYKLEVQATTLTTHVNMAVSPDSPFREHVHSTVVGGVTVGVRTVDPSTMKLEATQSPTSGLISVVGNLSPAPLDGPAYVTLDYVDPTGAATPQLVSVDASGTFRGVFQASGKPGGWSVRGIWSGTLRTSSALTTVSANLQ
jgi:hypothetical protein